jgi:hypothetical protein
MAHPKVKSKLAVELSKQMLIERLLVRILTEDKNYAESSAGLYKALIISIPEEVEEIRKDFCIGLLEDEDLHPEGDTERTMLIQAFREKFPDDFEIAQEAYFFCKDLTESDYVSLGESLKK